MFPSCDLDDVDCIDHVAEGNTKVSCYICQKMLPHIRMIDLDETLYDLIAFDGASKVQKAGTLMDQHFHRCTVLGRLDHAFSLLFGKVMAVRLIK